MAGLKASTRGVIKIERARKEKNLPFDGAEACKQASKIIIKQARKEKKLPFNGVEACKQASKIIDSDWEAEEDIYANGVSTSTWKRFLKGTINIRPEAFKAFCQVLDLDYLDICGGKYARINLCLDADFRELYEDEIISKLKEIESFLDGERFKVIKIERGSILLKLQTSIKGYRKLLELSQSGQLQEIMGFPVKYIELESIEPEDTREWLESLFNQDWQPAETVLAASSIRSSVNDTESSAAKVAKAKIIDLSKSQSVVILVQFTSRSDEEVRASLRVYPTENNTYLPEGLVIKVLDEQDSVSLSKEVESYADSVQIGFSFDPQGQFKIELTLENINITENLFEN